MNEVVKLISPQNVSSDILSKNALLADYVDWDSRQSFDDFCINTNVKYQSNDFCMLAKKDVLDKLLKKGKIYLSELESFGWFDKSVHYTKWRTFIEHSPEIFSKLSDTNQSSFSQFKENIRSLDELDRLKGALLLSWYYNSQEYEKFFSKIEIKNKSRWLLNLSELSNTDLQIFSQLILICTEDQAKFDQPIYELIANKISTKNSNREIVETNFILAQKLLYTIKEYMLDVSALDKEEFINYLISKKPYLGNNTFTNELDLLHKKYVQQLRVEDYTNPIIKRLSKVISVIDSDIGEIRKDLNSFGKFELFLLGLIKGQDKVESSGFNVNNIVYFSLEVICDSLIDIQPRSVGEQEVIRMNFDSKAVELDVGNKFEFLNDSINAFRYKLELYNHRDKIVLQLEEIQEEIGATNRAIRSRRNELDALNRKLSKLIDENLKKNEEIKSFESEKKLSSFNTIVDNYKKGQNEAELTKNITSLKKEEWNDFVYAYKNDPNLIGKRGTHLDSFEENKDGSIKKSSHNKKKVVSTILSLHKEDLFSKKNKQKSEENSNSEISQSAEFEHVEGLGIKKVPLTDKKEIEKLETDKMWIRNS